MRLIPALGLLSILLGGCGGAGARDASKELGRPFPMQCGAFELNVPGGGMISYDEDRNVIVEWQDRKARLQITSEGQVAKTPLPPIVVDESTAKPVPEGGPSPEPKPEPKPKDPNAERRVLERLFEKRLREMGCNFTRDERADVTWYSCVKVAKNGHVRVLVSVSKAEMCFALCASLDSDPKARATCDAVAPAE